MQKLVDVVALHVAKEHLCELVAWEDVEIR